MLNSRIGKYKLRGKLSLSHTRITPEDRVRDTFKPDDSFCFSISKSPASGSQDVCGPFVVLLLLKASGGSDQEGNCSLNLFTC